MPVISRLPQGGGGGGVDELYNFPISIQTAQPTPIRNGHIWIQANIASQITSIKILETLQASEPNGTLMLVVGDLVYNSFSASHQKKLTDGSSKNFSIAKSNGSNTWLLQSLSGDITASIHAQNRPMVYSKIGGVLDVEDAFIWSGSAWIRISQKGSYVAVNNNHANHPRPNVYNYNLGNNQAVFNVDLNAASVNYGGLFNSDGTYYYTHNHVFKRTGDIFELYYTIPETFNHTWVGTGNVIGFVREIRLNNTHMSGDGNTLVVYYRAWFSNAYWSLIRVYTNNGTTFTVSQAIQNGSSSSFMQGVYTNHNGTLIIAGGVGSSSSCKLNYFFKNGSTFETTDKWINAPISSWNNLTHVLFHGNTIYVQGSTPSGDILVSYTANFATRTIGSGTLTEASYNSNQGHFWNIPYCITMNSNGFILGRRQVDSLWQGFNHADNSKYTVNFSTAIPDVSGGYVIAFNLIGDRVAITHRGNGWRTTAVYSVSINTTTKVVTMALLTTVQSFSDTSGWMVPSVSIAPNYRG